MITNRVIALTLAIFLMLPIFVSAETFTVVVLPDTQIYSASYPDVFTNQTLWIKSHNDSLNIKMVVHLGDITHNNNASEWRNANTSMSVLDDFVPYVMVRGNHDSTANFNDYFNFTRWAGKSYYGGHYPATGNENSYVFFNASGEKFIVIGYDYCPSLDEVVWLNDTMTTFESYNKIVFTHSFMSYNGLRDDYDYSSCLDKTADGNDMFRRVIQFHDKVRLVLSGHQLNDGLARRTDVVNGYLTHQILQNYQWPVTGMLGDEGWLRYYTFDIPNNRIYAKTYSPNFNRFNTSTSNQFSLWWSR